MSEAKQLTPDSPSYVCWVCKKKQTGNPANTSHAINGDFHYCYDCWKPIKPPLKPLAKDHSPEGKECLQAGRCEHPKKPTPTERANQFKSQLRGLGTGYYQALEFIDELTREQERVQDEHNRRCYYQDIVYQCCNMLDSAYGNLAMRGTGIVCGTVGNPTTEVQDALKKLIQERDQQRSELERMLKLLAEKDERIGWLEQQREVECQQKNHALNESEQCLKERDKLRAENAELKRNGAELKRMFEFVAQFTKTNSFVIPRGHNPVKEILWAMESKPAATPEEYENFTRLP